jgi:3-oxoacyl-[acyl-carrier protein] reductase
VRVALVTGGASGLGRACGERLRADGLEVVTADIAEGADIRLDVTDDQAVADAVRALGRVDVLLNSAGVIGPNRPLWETTVEEWQELFAVNVHGMVSTCRAVIPGMRQRGWGRIVNFASIAGKDGNPNLSAYSASKAAVIGLTKSLGKELALDGVIVNAIAPAVIDTPMNAKTAPEVLAHITSLIPMRRVGQPEEVAALVAWLVSDACSFSTGAVYDLSGGRATY